MSGGRYHWSNCAYPARFFKINAVAAVPWLGLALLPSWNMLWAAIGLTTFFLYVELIKKMSVAAFMRSIGVLLVGRMKSTRNVLKDAIK